MTETLSKKQEEILKKFYTGPSENVLLNKSERDALWKKTKQKKTYDSSVLPDIKCPALFHQIQRSMESGNNIQSAVFSECAYAQTLANMFGLEKFVNCEEDDFSFPEGVKNLLSSNNLEPRYVYLSKDNTGMLIQAGGCEGVDSAYITIPELSIYTIEFKEPYAKTSEPDLPKYDESGKLVIEEEWIRKNPQFKKMIYEHTDLNFFDNMGKNIHDFTYDSVAYAVEWNYQSKKKADVICTEDQNGCFVMIPANHASQWAEIEGEIRPAGRNHYKVWTKDALKGFLKAMDAVGDRRIGVDKSKLKIRNPRGGEDVPTGYKINSLFFVLAENCEEKDGMIYFDIDDVRQIKPTIAGKMSFKNLRYEDVKKYYGFIAENT